MELHYISGRIIDLEGLEPEDLERLHAHVAEQAGTLLGQLSVLNTFSPDSARTVDIPENTVGESQPDNLYSLSAYRGPTPPPLAA